MVSIKTLLLCPSLSLSPLYYYCIDTHVMNVRVSSLVTYLPNSNRTYSLFPTDIHKRSLGKPGYPKSLDTLERLTEIKGECLIIFGKQDNHVSREGRKEIKEAMEDAEYVLIKYVPI